MIVFPDQYRQVYFGFEVRACPYVLFISAFTAFLRPMGITLWRSPRFILFLPLRALGTAEDFEKD